MFLYLYSCKNKGVAELSIFLKVFKITLHCYIFSLKNFILSTPIISSTYRCFHLNHSRVGKIHFSHACAHLLYFIDKSKLKNVHCADDIVGLVRESGPLTHTFSSLVEVSTKSSYEKKRALIRSGQTKQHHWCARNYSKYNKNNHTHSHTHKYIYKMNGDAKKSLW